MKKFLSMLLALVMTFALVACGQQAEQAPATEEDANNVPMQYITADDLKAAMGDYLIVDVRKTADYCEARIPGAIGIDMDAAKEGDAAAGVTAMTEGLKAATGDKTAGDAKIVLVCYSGKRYAQAATNALSTMGAKMENVYTLEGGFTNWSEVNKDLIKTGDTEMKYITAAELKDTMDNYLVIDLRKTADSTVATIPGAKLVDMDAAKEGDLAAGVLTMRAALRDLTGSENGGDKKIVLVCYSGKRYAQASTNVLATIGANMDNVLTLEGGFNNWKKTYIDDVERADYPMQYITAAELKDVLDNNAEGYLVIDVRKAADSSTATIPGAIAIDMDAAKEGDFAAGVAAMSAGLTEATGSETGAEGQKIVLVCYSGKRYAQASTNALYHLGAAMANVYTLEGGFTNWSEVYPDAVQ